MWRKPVRPRTCVLVRQYNNGLFFVRLNQKPLDVTNHSVAREVVTFFTLPPGDYVVVPQTGVAHCEGKFLLRIFTDEHSNIWFGNY